MKDHPRPRFDPRSPVQPGPSTSPYLLAGAVAAAAIWIFQQDLIQQIDTQSRESSAEEKAVRPSDAPRDMRTIFSADDYPVDAQAKGEQGTVRAELTVDTRGKVAGCKIVSGSGSASLDQATCRILTSRARFTPARDPDGKPMTTTVTTPPIKWQLEG